MHKPQSGYVLLLSTLVVGAVGTAIATSILMLSVGNNLNSLAAEQSAQALANATACMEDTLEQLRLDDTYVGDTTINFEQGSCTIEPVVVSGGFHVIQVTGTVNTIVRKLEVEVDDIGPPTVIESWRDVDTFTAL